MARTRLRHFSVASKSRWWLIIGVWILLAAPASVRTLIAPDSHSVFPLFAASSVHWWSGQSLYAYYPSFDLFRYPPTFAVLVTPFAWLGNRLGGVFWIWLNLGVFGFGLARFARDLGDRCWSRQQRAWFFGLSLLIASRGIWNGQCNALVAGLILLAASSLVRECWWACSALLAAAVWTKLTPLAPALLLCAVQPRRLLPRFLLTAFLGALIPFLTRPPDVVLTHYVDWAAHLASSGAARWPGFRDAWTLWLTYTQPFREPGGAFRLLAPIDSLGYRIVQLLTALAVLSWSRWQQARSTCPRWLVRSVLGMGMAWLMLFGPAVEHATFALLAPFVAWSVLERDYWPRGRSLSLAAIFLVGILAWNGLSSPFAEYVPLLTTALPLGTAFFMLWLVAYAHGCPTRIRHNLVFSPAIKRRTALRPIGEPTSRTIPSSEPRPKSASRAAMATLTD